ncbi:hypothetical protein FRC11_009921 [Ceratobasidium sp. 423]|nr:hypothetical protein FRC11_009921 [Ceratobasidium sp. 423]
MSMRLSRAAARHLGHHGAASCPKLRYLLHTSASARSPATEQVPFARSHLVSFFAEYPNFKYDPSQPFMDEFWRLVETEGYGHRSKRFKSARKRVGDAILRQFKDIYGAHSCDVHVWHRFFNAIGIDEAPRDIGLCYKQAKLIHLNICDLIDRPVTGAHVKRFPTVKDLSDYTFEDINRPKIVPPISKKRDPIVGRLFRPVTNPPKPKDQSTPSIPSITATVTKESRDTTAGAGH